MAISLRPMSFHCASTASVGLAAALVAPCHRFEHPDASISLAALLVPRSLARHFALGSGTSTRRRPAGLHCSSPAGNRCHGSNSVLRSRSLLPPKLHGERSHRPLGFQRPVCVSRGQGGSRAGTPLAKLSRRERA